MPRITAEQRAEIRSAAKERVELRYQRDLARLRYAEMHENARWKREKPAEMLELATEIEMLDERLQEVEGAKLSERLGVPPSAVSMIASGRLFIRMRD